MKRLALSVLPFVAAVTFHAQRAAPLPTTLPELARILPALVHKKQLDFGPFSDAFMDALKRDPAAVDATIPIIEKDLSDPDRDVRFHATSLLYGIEFVRRDSSTIFAPLYPQLATAIRVGDPGTQGITLNVIQMLGQRAPDAVVDSTRQLVKSKPSSYKVLAASVGALMAARPTDAATQDVVIELLNDPSLSLRQREIVLNSAARSGGGPKIVDYVVQQANTATDRSMQETAFSAATTIGLSALDRISDQLAKVAQDSTEPEEEREVARRALSERARLSNR